MSTRLYAVQHIRKMRGGSQAHLLRASDGAYYVTKFQNNPQHLRVLANEMFATRLAHWLGLPVPRVEVIEISDWLIANSSDLRVEAAGCTSLCSSGPQLASLYPDSEAEVFDYLPENMLAKVANIGDFARCLVLDSGREMPMADRRSSFESDGAVATLRHLSTRATASTPGSGHFPITRSRASIPGTVSTRE
jgi:hypothetical protein